jgi:hypothetical protein
MLKEFKKPMWNDGYAKDMPWLNYFNEYERTHCCFDSDGNGPDGDGGTHANISSISGKDNSISGREGEDKTSQQERDEEAATAAAAAAAAGETTGVGVEEGPAPGYEGPGGQFGEISIGIGSPPPDEQGGLPPDSYDPSQDLYAGINPDTGDPQVKDGTGKDVTDEVGYNDLVGSGYFGLVDDSVQANAQAKADQIQMDAMYNALDVEVTVDKDGNFSYSGPDAFEVAMGEIGSGIKSGFGAVTDMAKGLTSITPEGLVMGALTGRGPGGGLTRMAIGEYDPILGGLFSGGKFKADPYDSPSMRAYAKELEDKAKKEGKTVEEVAAELANKNPNEIDEEGYYGMLSNAIAREEAEREAANRAATADQLSRDLGFVAPDAPSTTGLSSLTDADFRSYEGVGGPGSQAYEVGDPTYDPDRVDLGSITSADLAAAAIAAENAKATESQRMEDIVMGPDLSRATPSLGGKDQTEADRRGQISYDALGVTPTTTKAKEKEASSTAVSDFLSSIAAALRGPTDPQAALAAISKRDREALDKIQRENRSMGGMVYRDGGGTASEDDKPFEFSMADYFKNQKTTPFYSTKPNEYLVALQKQIYPDLTTDEIYRRLGYRPAPDPDDTSSATSYYNNPYGMNI